MKLALIPGHSPSSPGAGMAGLFEWPLMSVLVGMVEKRLPPKIGSLVQVYERPDHEEGLVQLVKTLNRDDVDRILSLHLNACEGRSPDLGYCIHDGTAAAQSLANRLTEAVRLDGIDRRDPVYRENLYVLSDTEAPAVLDEVAFIDRHHHQEKVLSKLPLLADRYSDVITEEIEAVKEAQTG